MVVRYFATLYVLLSGPAYSDTFAAPETFLQVRSISVKIFDRVTDSCLLNAKSIEMSAKANLSRSSIMMSEESAYYLVYDVVGYAVHSSQGQVGCIGFIDMALFTTVPRYGVLYLAQSHRLLSGPTAIDADAAEVAEGFTNEVVTSILQARMAATPTKP